MIRIRFETFETNSSSSHTIVFGNTWDSLAVAEKLVEPFYFPVRFYEFGNRGKNIYEDISRKFSFFFQGFVCRMSFAKDDEELYDIVKKKNSNDLDQYEYIKKKDYMSVRARIMMRYNRFMELLQIASEKIREMKNIRLDFSDMKIVLSDGTYPYVTSKSNPFQCSATLSEAITAKMEIGELVEKTGKLLDMEKSSYDKEKIDFFQLTDFLLTCLGFAFSQNCVILEGDDSISIESDPDFNAAITRYFEKNNKEVEIFSR